VRASRGQEEKSAEGGNIARAKMKNSPGAVLFLGSAVNLLRSAPPFSPSLLLSPLSARGKRRRLQGTLATLGGAGTGGRVRQDQIKTRPRPRERQHTIATHAIRTIVFLSVRTARHVPTSGHIAHLADGYPCLPQLGIPSPQQSPSQRSQGPQQTTMRSVKIHDLAHTKTGTLGIGRSIQTADANRRRKVRKRTWLSVPEPAPDISTNKGHKGLPAIFPNRTTVVRTGVFPLHSRQPRAYQDGQPMAIGRSFRSRRDGGRRDFPPQYPSLSGVARPQRHPAPPNLPDGFEDLRSPQR